MDNNLSLLVNNFNNLVKIYNDRHKIFNISSKINDDNDNLSKLKDKKYMQLYFEFDNDIKNHITLSKNNYIIQYTLYIELLDYNKTNNYNISISLGIKNNKNNKLSILNGSKVEKNLVIDSIDGLSIINNCFLYSSLENYEELYIIISFSNNILINNKKSLLKLLIT